MRERAGKAFFFMSASVELITAMEIKMRGSNEGLLEMRNLLAVSTAVQFPLLALADSAYHHHWSSVSGGPFSDSGLSAKRNQRRRVGVGMLRKDEDEEEERGEEGTGMRQDERQRWRREDKQEKRWRRKGKERGAIKVQSEKGWALSLLRCCGKSLTSKLSPGSFSDLDDLPCGEYIMNVPLLSADHNESQGNLFPVSTRA